MIRVRSKIYEKIIVQRVDCLFRKLRKIVLFMNKVPVMRKLETNLWQCNKKQTLTNVFH